MQPYDQLQQQQQQQPAPVTYVINVQQSVQKTGKFGGNYSGSGSKGTGALLVIAGLLCVGAGILETVYLADNNSSTVSYNLWAGYWCGALMIIAGAVAAEAGRQKTDSLITATLVLALIFGIGSSMTIIGLEATVIPDEVVSEDTVLMVAHGIMTGAACTAVIESVILSIFCITAFICTKPAAPTATQSGITMQQQQQQLPSSYNQFQTTTTLPQQQLQQQVLYTSDIATSQLAPQPVQNAGRFFWSFSAAGSKSCGGLTVTMGILCIAGALMETIHIAVDGRAAETYSLNDYAGFWCGAFIIASGSIATEAGRQPKDALIIANLVGAAVGVVFASTLIGLTAPLFDTTIGDAILLAAWGTMIGTASLALLMTVVIGVICLKAIICRKPAPALTGVQYVMAPPLQQQQQQQQFPVYHIDTTAAELAVAANVVDLATITTQQHQTPQIQYQTTIVQQAPVAGRFGMNFWASGSKVCGGLMGTMGVLCICAAITETIYTAVELNGVYTLNQYAGYWCGGLIIAAGSTAEEAGRRQMDALIISSLAGAVVGITFASTLIGLTAEVFGINNTVLLAAYGVMVGAASLTLLLSGIIAVICLKAIICRKPAAAIVARHETITHQQQQQEEHQERERDEQSCSKEETTTDELKHHHEEKRDHSDHPEPDYDL